MRRHTLLALLGATVSLVSCSDHPAPVDPLPGTQGVHDRRPASPYTDLDLTLQDVMLRPGVSVDLHVKVFVDENRRATSCTASKTALAVAGFAHTAATWEPFAEALFEAHPRTVCRLVALDLPAHGASALPTGGLLFGDLTLDDYATALLGALGRLAEHGIEPRSLIGHSQGGMLIQMAQQRLAEQERTLRDAFGIREVVLLAPTLPKGLPWAFADNGTASSILAQFLVLGDPALGTHFRIPNAVWPAVFFSNLHGQVASGAPTDADVAARGFNAPEPLLSALQLVGAPPFGQRPTIDAGIFSGRHGSQLAVIGFEHDQLVRPEEAAALFEYLTAGRNGRKFAVVSGQDAVHDLYISDPAALLAGTRIVLP